LDPGLEGFAEASDGRILAMGQNGGKIYFLDNPELLLGHAVGVDRAFPKPALV